MLAEMQTVVLLHSVVAVAVVQARLARMAVLLEMVALALLRL